MKHIYLVTILSFIFISESLNAQDIHFTQFTQSPLTVNPAQAGTTAWVRGIIQYRTQWGAVTVPYRTIAASCDVKVQKRWTKVANATSRFKPGSEQGLGWGINIYNDKAGDGAMGTLFANGTIAYQVKITKRGLIAAGLQAGIMQRKIDFSALHWGSQYDANSSTGYNTSFPADKAIANGNSSFVLPDFSGGLLYSYKKNERYMRGNDQMDIVVGGSMFHFGQPKYSFLGTNERLYSRYVIHSQAIIGIQNTSLSIMPGLMYMKQGPNQELLAGLLVRHMLHEDSKYTGYIKGATVALGGYYRNKDSFAAAVMLEFSSYSIGMSYDINISRLKAASSGRGGFEICLRFLNPSPFLYTKASFNN